MVLNYIWIAFFLIAFVVAAVKTLFLGDAGVFDAIISSTFDSAESAFKLSIGLTGVLTLWMGIMKVGEAGGVVNVLARWLSPVFSRLFPDLPKGHPVNGSIFMNLSANMLGLDNAATPLGLKAMRELQELNGGSERASNSMIMFLVLNTSGLTIIPISIMMYRSQLGAAQPTDVFVPILIATFCSTLAGLVAVCLYQRINLLNRTLLLFLLTVTLVVACVIWLFAGMDRDAMDGWSTLVANVFLFTVIIIFIVAALLRRVNVYETFIEGAKDGFSTAVKIIPYLVAILVAVGVFRASGAMDWLIEGIAALVRACGIDDSFVPIRRTSGERDARLDGHDVLYPRSLLRQRGCQADTSCPAVRAHSRFCGIDGCRGGELSVLFLKRLARATCTCHAAAASSLLPVDAVLPELPHLGLKFIPPMASEWQSPAIQFKT